MPPRRISKTITFSLPPEMFEQVQRVKEEEGRDMSELVREALRLYMEEREWRRSDRYREFRAREYSNRAQDGGRPSDEHLAGDHST